MRLRVVLSVFAALAVLAAGGVYLLVRNISSHLPLPLVTQSCSARAGGEVVLDPDQMANAATIAAVGVTRGVPDQAVIVALATAAQESKLRNLDGGDRDSVGLFQQRPSQGWGRPDQIADPRYSAGRFYAALMRVKGWQSMPVATAAQRVQRSADGSAYAQWEDEARILTDALLGDTPGAVTCTITDQPVRRGTAAADALAHDMTLDWGRVSQVSTSVVGLALAVDGTRSGWRYAHWLVAHAADQGVKSVTYGQQRWTAKAGSWSKAPSSPANTGSGTGAGQVVAEVYAER